MFYLLDPSNNVLGNGLLVLLATAALRQQVVHWRELTTVLLHY